MRSILSVSLVCLAYVFSGAAHADDRFLPKLVTAPVEKVFSPIGFDDNDNVELIVHGQLFNSCMKVGPATARVSEETRTIYVTAKSWSYTRILCNSDEMFNPFTQTIQLGLLTQGTYKVVLEDRPEAEVSPLVISAHSVSSADDYFYAPVEEVFVREDFETQKQTVTLNGRFAKQQRGCLAIDRVETKIVPGNIVVVQPITEKRFGADCPSDGDRSFNVTATLPTFLHGDYLFHVRVISGQSINRVYPLGD